jgi:hypothetical protein
MYLTLWSGAERYLSPQNTWHGFANPDHELLLLWVVSPAGLDGFFRDTCNPPGGPPKQLTREQINEIARKYATEFIISRSRWTAEYCGKHARWKWRYRGPGRIVGNVPKMHASRVWQTPGNGKIPPDERVEKPEQ